MSEHRKGSNAMGKNMIFLYSLFGRIILQSKIIVTYHNTY